ncbi:MAG: hypothetical protein K2X77_10105 [Candidatus Obscuribacterales bacterium]|jgi:hypothetical protein|nr:hypothetical protein [Candidatus Obscuribacterales bacterium]
MVTNDAGYGMFFCKTSILVFRTAMKWRAQVLQCLVGLLLLGGCQTHVRRSTGTYAGRTSNKNTVLQKTLSVRPDKLDNLVAQSTSDQAQTLILLHKKESPSKFMETLDNLYFTPKFSSTCGYYGKLSEESIEELAVELSRRREHEIVICLLRFMSFPSPSPPPPPVLFVAKPFVRITDHKDISKLSDVDTRAVRWIFDSSCLDQLSTLANLRKLQYLSLSPNLDSVDVSDKQLEFLRNQTELRWLSLDDVHTTGKFLTYQDFPTLEYLSLVGTCCNDKYIAKLKDTPVRFLDLSSTNITGSALSSISNIKNLEHLRLARTSVDDTFLPKLVAVTSLRFLDLRNTRVSPKGILLLETRLQKCEILPKSTALHAKLEAIKQRANKRSFVLELTQSSIPNVSEGL